MSSTDALASDGPTRRTVVKGAAWAMPAVVVAAPAPTVAASTGALHFSGAACKLPGSATDAYKGYVFELIASSSGNPTNTVTVITGVTVNGVPEPKFALSVRSGSCTCSTCGNAPSNHQFCTPSGTNTQRVLLYTAGGASGSSANAELCITYMRYGCDCTPLPGVQPATFCSGSRATPPMTGNKGGSCGIQDVLPLPA
ncbi:hypothetical protein [Terrabacter sp. NPDC080008]|uniref:hypothetical protein n=1 Tax=Terrabacter sp. NPDC080008 TaxID=3155176 RepID=UPI00344FAD63